MNVSGVSFLVIKINADDFLIDLLSFRLVFKFLFWATKMTTVTKMTQIYTFNNEKQ